MTRSVCLNCGEMKPNAFFRCENCGYEPITLEDRAKHFLCSDLVASPAIVDQASAAIKAGKKIVFNDSDVKKMAASLKKLMKEQGMA